MKSKISETLAIPSGISCEFSNNVLTCKKGNVSISRTLRYPNINVKIEKDSITINSDKANKNQLKFIMTALAHLRNMFSGLDKNFIYKLQSCNVHFPMTLKVEKEKLLISNFLGEKKPRSAVILPNVHVELKGQLITVSSHDREAAGQTAANFEKATKIRNRDRRIFQDGIYIIEKTAEEAE